MSDRPLLTDEERAALKLSGDLANAVRRLIPDTEQGSHDWNEAAAALHVVQRMIGAQAAARAFPDEFRPLGGWPEGRRLRVPSDVCPGCWHKVAAGQRHYSLTGAPYPGDDPQIEALYYECRGDTRPTP